MATVTWSSAPRVDGATPCTDGEVPAHRKTVCRQKHSIIEKWQRIYRRAEVGLRGDTHRPAIELQICYRIAPAQNHDPGSIVPYDIGDSGAPIKRIEPIPAARVNPSRVCRLQKQGDIRDANKRKNPYFHSTWLGFI